ncbi:AAA family ATPase [Patescibacteria group bacterium]|nr:AAA family ATPase [Patescibacteria group bacterium]MBU1755037.1 AAA family ATPase [Patescibacteria group bacterium]
MILGLTGTNGAGKGSVVDYLVSKKGFAHYSVRAAIVEEVLRRGLELNRTNIGATGTDLRHTYGAAYFSTLFMSQAKEDGVDNYVIESIRAVAEAENIKKAGGFAIAVDAPIDIRYERITGRGSDTDKVSFEEFVEQEQAEYISKDPSDPAQMNFKVVMEQADYTLINDGTLDELGVKIEEMLIKLNS